MKAFLIVLLTIFAYTIGITQSYSDTLTVALTKHFEKSDLPEIGIILVKIDVTSLRSATVLID